MLYEAIPVWERAYAVSETKRSVEGAAGTRDADKAILPRKRLVSYRVDKKKYQTRLQSDASLEASGYNREESL